MKEIVKRIKNNSEKENSGSYPFPTQSEYGKNLFSRDDQSISDDKESRRKTPLPKWNQKAYT